MPLAAAYQVMHRGGELLPKKCLGGFPGFQLCHYFGSVVWFCIRDLGLQMFFLHQNSYSLETAR